MDNTVRTLRIKKAEVAQRCVYLKRHRYRKNHAEPAIQKELTDFSQSHLSHTIHQEHKTSSTAFAEDDSWLPLGPDQQSLCVKCYTALHDVVMMTQSSIFDNIYSPHIHLF